MGTNDIRDPLTRRLSGCPGTALTRRLGEVPIHIDDLPSPAEFPLDASLRIHETEYA